MLFNIEAAVVLLSAASAVASPSYIPLQQWKNSPLGKSSQKHVSPKPHVTCHPKTNWLSPPAPTERNKTCYVQSYGNGTDDSPLILDAIDSCNNGGHVVFSEGTQYTIGTALNLTYLNQIDIGWCAP